MLECGLCSDCWALVSTVAEVGEEVLGELVEEALDEEWVAEVAVWGSEEEELVEEVVECVDVLWEEEPVELLEEVAEVVELVVEEVVVIEEELELEEVVTEVVVGVGDCSSEFQVSEVSVWILPYSQLTPK